MFPFLRFCFIFIPMKCFHASKSQAFWYDAILRIEFILFGFHKFIFQFIDKQLLTIVYFYKPKRMTARINLFFSVSLCTQRRYRH